MVRSFALAALTAASSISAAPAVEKRQSAGLTDPDILNFALTLEHLEATFYADGMKNYTDSDFEKAGYTNIRSHIEEIAADEAQHVQFLTGALTAAGGSPVGASTYVFPSTDVKSFLGLSQILEGVGVAAYLGAAPAITNPAYLAAAGSVLTVEARHNAFIRYVNGQSPFPGPEDAALSPRSVVTLAAGFFAPGAQNAPSIVPFPALAVTAANASVGQTITAKADNVTADGQLYCAFISGLFAGFSEWTASSGNCMIPTANVTAGQTYVLLTSAQAVTDNTTLAGPAIIDVGDAATDVTASSAGGMSGSSSSSGGNSKSGAASFTPRSILPAGLSLSLVAALALL